MTLYVGSLVTCILAHRWPGSRDAQVWRAYAVFIFTDEWAKDPTKEWHLESVFFCKTFSKSHCIPPVLEWLSRRLANYSLGPVSNYPFYLVWLTSSRHGSSIKLFGYHQRHFVFTTCWHWRAKTMLLITNRWCPVALTIILLSRTRLTMLSAWWGFWVCCAPPCPAFVYRKWTCSLCHNQLPVLAVAVRQDSHACSHRIGHTI